MVVTIVPEAPSINVIASVLAMVQSLENHSEELAVTKYLIPGELTEPDSASQSPNSSSATSSLQNRLSPPRTEKHINTELED
jgi:hypothetical protein